MPQAKKALALLELKRLELNKMESRMEIERLAAEVVRDASSEQSGALVELLTHIIPHDNSSWSMYARSAVIKADDELIDEAADLIVAKRREDAKQ